MTKGFITRGVLALLLSLLFSPALLAATKHHRVVWDADPSTTAIIAFSPDGTSTSPWIEYGATTDVGSWATLSILDQQTFGGSLVSYFGRLAALTPDSAVYYRVCDQDGCGQRFWFKTAPGTGNNSPFVVIAGGDTRTGWDNRRQGNVLISKIRPLLIMHGGDYTNANTASEMNSLLDDWVLTYSDDLIDGYPYKRTYPIIPTHGNHEDGDFLTLCRVFGVDYDQDSDCDAYDTYGAFNVSPLLRVYILNSEFKDNPWLGGTHQTTMNSWLAGDLTSNGPSASWRFAQYHKPMFPHTSGKSEGTILHTWWANDFYDDAMNLVVESDSHMMKMTESLEPSGGTFINETDGDATGGTVYVGEGSWGAPARSADDPKSWTIDLASIQQLKVITVHPDRLEVRTAQFDDTATTLTREERASDPVALPKHVNWWDNSGIGEVLDLKRSAQERSVIDGTALFSPGCTFSLCDFLDASSISGATIDSWLWDFGDGNTSTVQHPQHGYAASGRYNVTLKVVDSNGTAHVFGKSLNATRADDVILDVQIANGDDDVEEILNDSTNYSSGDMYMNSSDLELINEGARGDQAVGLRFNSITVPQGKTVTSSYIRFTTDETNTRTTNLLFEAQAVDNAPGFVSTAFNLTGRAMTSASVAWNNVANWSTVGESHDSPDLSAVVQEVVDRTGWTSGNSMVFKITGTSGGRRVAESYNGVSASAPTLHIEYSDTANSCTANRLIPAGEWVPFALPCDPGDANTVEDIFTVFAGLDATRYEYDWYVYSFDAISQSYKWMTLTDRMYPGHGYWILTENATTVSFTGVANMTGDLGLAADATGDWNFVGFTENDDMPWADFQAYNGNDLVGIAAADALGLVSKTGYVWTGSNYDFYDAVTPGSFVNIQPGRAVWVKAFEPDTMLRIEPPAVSGDIAYAEPASTLQSSSASKTPKVKAPKTEKKDKADDQYWFIRLIAESGRMQDGSNVLGQHSDSLDGLDSNDIKELTPIGAKYLSLTFTNESFTDNGWGYTTDYRTMTKIPKGEWPFVVRATADVEEVTLRWEGETSLLHGAILRDEQTGKKIPARPDHSYTFKNNGGENRFTFIIH